MNLFDKKNKIKEDIFSFLDNKTLIRPETAGPKQKDRNFLSLSKNSSDYNQIFIRNKIPSINDIKIHNNINLNDSFDKLDNILSNYYEERKKSRNLNSVSKNTDYIKRFKNRFEKGVKLIPLEKDFKNFNFTKTNFDVIKPRSSIMENWNKFEKKHINSNRETTNSDILRLELINLNCYSNNEIEQLKGIEKLKVKTRKRRASSIDQL